jgi:hypothetical protein
MILNRLRNKNLRVQFLGVYGVLIYKFKWVFCVKTCPRSGMVVTHIKNCYQFFRLFF